MIKILKDICVLQPDFPKINDICVRIIKRICDEEAIRVRRFNSSFSLCMEEYNPGVLSF